MAGTDAPPALVEARQLDPLAHLHMQAVLQPFVDNAISKTINVAADMPFERFADLYRQAHALGLKGCTVFRPNPVTGAILSQPPRTSGCNAAASNARRIEADMNARPATPRIGLALGGGSARGWAHIGVIRALRDAGIEPDIVCGTSIGALVGAAYVDGDLDRLEAWVRSLRLQTVVSFLDFSLNGGLIKGDKLIAFFPQPFCRPRHPANWRARSAPSPPTCSAAAKCGCARAGCRTRCAPRSRCPACSPRCSATAAGWSTAAWSIRCRCRCAARWGRTSSSPST